MPTESIEGSKTAILVLLIVIVVLLILVLAGLIGLFIWLQSSITVVDEQAVRVLLGR